jgi:hypothetical protein
MTTGKFAPFKRGRITMQTRTLLLGAVLAAPACGEERQLRSITERLCAADGAGAALSQLPVELHSNVREADISFDSGLEADAGNVVSVRRCSVTRVEVVGKGDGSKATLDAVAIDGQGHQSTRTYVFSKQNGSWRADYQLPEQAARRDAARREAASKAITLRKEAGALASAFDFEGAKKKLVETNGSIIGSPGVGFGQTRSKTR